MGMPKTEKHIYGNEPEHEVEITKPFYMGVFEVTQARVRESDQGEAESVPRRGRPGGAR